jgi:hypothetical protein
MAIRVRVASMDEPDSLIALKLADLAADSPELRKKIGDRLQRTYAAHARNALVQIGQALNFGAPGGLSAGPRHFTAVTPDGEVVSITTPSFDALTPGYARRNPKSVVMWRKRKPRGLSRFYSRAGKKVVVTVHDLPYLRSHHKGKVRIGFGIRLEDTFKPMVRTLIMEPFVSGDETEANKFKAKGLGRDSVSLLGYPEAGPYKRPFVAQLSAALGRRALTALRRL